MSAEERRVARVRAGAGGPHAQDRGLEAVAYAWDEMNRVPRSTQWQKQVSKTDVITLNKTYHIAPRGVTRFK